MLFRRRFLMANLIAKLKNLFVSQHDFSHSKSSFNVLNNKKMVTNAKSKTKNEAILKTASMFYLPFAVNIIKSSSIGNAFIMLAKKLTAKLNIKTKSEEHLTPFEATKINHREDFISEQNVDFLNASAIKSSYFGDHVSNGEADALALKTALQRHKSDYATENEADALALKTVLQRHKSDYTTENEADALAAKALFQHHKSDHATENGAYILVADAIFQEHQSDYISEKKADAIAADVVFQYHENDCVSKEETHIFTANTILQCHHGEQASNKEALLFLANSEKLQTKTDSATADEGGLVPASLNNFYVSSESRTKLERNFKVARTEKLNTDVVLITTCQAGLTINHTSILNSRSNSGTTASAILNHMLSEWIDPISKNNVLGITQSKQVTQTDNIIHIT